VRQRACNGGGRRDRQRHDEHMLHAEFVEEQVYERKGGDTVAGARLNG
jgi:hypothetical protein